MDTRFKITHVLAILLSLSLSFVLFNSCKEEDETLVGNWKREGDFGGINRFGAASFVIGDAVYIVGGRSLTEEESKQLLSDCWRYDIHEGRWVEMAKFPGAPRLMAFGFASNGKGYVGCGRGLRGTANNFSDVWEFTPDQGIGSWTQVETFADSTINSAARYGCTTFTINEIGYVCGGFSNTHLNDVWAYDASKPMGQRWEQKAPMNKKRMNGLAFVIDNIAYLVGGDNNGNPTDFYAYHPDENKWTKLRDVFDATADDYDNDYKGITRDCGCAFVIDGHGYITLGKNPQLTTTTWEYHPDNDMWYRRSDFEGASRECAIGFTLQNQGFIATGKAMNKSFDDVWQFIPSEQPLEIDNN